MSSQSELWSRLSQVRSLQFVARSGSAIGWIGAGLGTVDVSTPAPKVLVFAELGTWQPADPVAHAIKFTNTFRWSTLEDRIRLEHLRFGPNKPVFLFDLIETDTGTWRDASPHQCSEDCYSALLTVKNGKLSVAWSIRGPRKREQIDYNYW